MLRVSFTIEFLLFSHIKPGCVGLMTFVFCLLQLRAQFRFQCRKSYSQLFFRPFEAESFLALTHGLRRGLYSSAAPRLFRRLSPAVRSVVAPDTASSRFWPWGCPPR